MNDLRCRVYLHALLPSHDRSTVFRHIPLEVIALDGAPAAECVWPVSCSEMPFTAWVPLRIPLAEGRITHVQGHSLPGDHIGHDILVSLSGQVAALLRELDARLGSRGPAADGEIELVTPRRKGPLAADVIWRYDNA